MDAGAASRACRRHMRRPISVLITDATSRAYSPREPDKALPQGTISAPGRPCDCRRSSPHSDVCAIGVKTVMRRQRGGGGRPLSGGILGEKSMRIARNLCLGLLALSASAMVVAAPAAAQQPQQKPNIILIVSDDFGYGD